MRPLAFKPIPWWFFENLGILLKIRKNHWKSQFCYLEKWALQHCLIQLCLDICSKLRYLKLYGIHQFPYSNPDGFKSNILTYEECRNIAIVCSSKYLHIDNGTRIGLGKSYYFWPVSNRIWTKRWAKKKPNKFLCLNPRFWGWKLKMGFNR